MFSRDITYPSSTPGHNRDRVIEWLAVSHVDSSGSDEAAEGQLSVIQTRLTVSGRINPIGIETEPRFGWRPPSNRQSAYELAIASTPGAADVVSTGKVESEASQGIAVPLTLTSSTRYFWRVRTWDGEDRVSEWSPDAFFETGLLNGEADWAGAKWIGGRQPQDHDWRNSTTAVCFTGQAGSPLTVLLRAQPVGKKWEETLAWTIGPRIVGNSRLTGAVEGGATALPVDSVRNWNAGDVVRVQHDDGEFRTTASEVGSSDVDDVVRFAIAPSVIYLSADPGLSAGEPLTVGDTDVTITSVTSAMGGCVFAFEPALAAPAAAGTRVFRVGTGISLAEPLPRSLPAGTAVVGESALKVQVSTRHYAGNTGVPGGIPAVVWGQNFYDPQSETNPTAAGGREVPGGVVDIPVEAGLTLENWTDEHELVVELDEDTATTSIDGVEVDRRTLNGDERRASGSVGFAAGTTAVIRRLAVTGDGGSIDVDFRTGANPLESGIAGPEGLRVGILNAMLPIANPAPLLRTSFEIPDAPVKAARLYATAGGQYELTVNGLPLTLDGGPAAADGSNIPRLVPDHTNFDRTVLYDSFDVTALVQSGSNVLAAELGRGWYGVTTPTEWYWNLANYQGAPRLRAKLVVTLADGSEHVVVTDDGWETTDGPTTFDSVYSGEEFDRRRADELSGWRTGGDAAEWQDAVVTAAPGHNPSGHGPLPTTREEPGFVAAKVRAHEAEPVLVNEIRQPDWIRETSPGSGVYVADFGQILTGFPVLTLDGVPTSAQGVTVRFRGGNAVTGNGTAESPFVVDEENGFHDANLQVNYYTVGSQPTQTWASRLTHWGFRYVELRNLDVALGRPFDPAADLGIVHVEVARSGFARTGRFGTDNDLVNRIQTNLEWAEQNNLLHKPTDTPSREKNGWSGDAMASSETQSLNWDVNALFTKYLRDFPDAQASTGHLPMILPAAKGGYGYDQTPGWDFCWSAVPCWDSAYFVMPAELERYYGNDSLYAELYPGQELLLNYYSKLFTEENDYLFRSSLGEYSGAGDAGDSAVINLQFYIHFADYMVRVGRQLGLDDRAEHYGQLGRTLRAAFLRNFWDDQARCVVNGNPESANAMAVAFDLIPGSDLPEDDPRYLAGSATVEDNRASALAAVAASIENAGYHLQAGMYGSRYEFMVLADHGYTDTVLQAVTVLDAPGYAVQIAQGATSLWEMWDRGSLNHHYRSNIATWFYQGLAGIRPTSEGYATLRIRPILPSTIAVPSGVPQFPGDVVERSPLNHVQASIDTPRGLVVSSWDRTEDGHFHLEIEVPPNTPTEVWVPGAAISDATPATRHLRTETWAGKSYEVYEAEAGTHRFESELTPQ
jgi:alpha-L-rhamnosidase